MNLPFVFSAYGRRPPSRNYSTRNRQGFVRTEIRSLTLLPSPRYAVFDTDNGQTVMTWHEIEGKLLRPVLLYDRPATIREIAEATDLILDPLESWFDDHPQAVFRAPKKRAGDQYYDVDAFEEDFLISRSDRDERQAAATRVYSECYQFDDKMLAPAAPPTWRVVLRGSRATMELVWSRHLPPNLPSFHFAAGSHEVALNFAKAVSHPNNVIVDEVGWFDPGTTGSPNDGALETARAFAPGLLWRFSLFRPHQLTGQQVDVLARLRNLYECFGSDDEADTTLELLARTEWPQLSEGMRTLIRLLVLRKNFLIEHHGPPELADF